MTSDGEIVLLHDDLLQLCTDLTGWAHERPVDELLGARLRASDGDLVAEHPLTLDEALRLLNPRSCLVQLEVKATMDADLANATAAALVERADVRSLGQQVEVISFWPSAVELAAAAGLRARLIIAAAYAPQALVDWAQTHNIYGVILEAPYWADDVVALWRLAGLSVASGVVNNPFLLSRLLPFGPELVSTDRPHELYEFITDGS